MSGKKVFISYSHDSDEHRERVLQLSERLRQDGFETILDQYVNGSPVEGWPRWMLNQLDDADFVLVVCTETYYRRFRGNEEPGKGVDWEGALITQELYDRRSRTLKFVPVFLGKTVADWLPEPLRGYSYYALTSEADYQQLYDFLLEQAGVEPGPLGTVKIKPRRTVEPLSFDDAESAATKGKAARTWLEMHTVQVSTDRTVTMKTQESGSVFSSESAATQYPVIVLVTVNDNETHALLDVFLGKGVAPNSIPKGEVTYTDLGVHGGHRLINTVCEMGAGGVGASQQRTWQAIKDWQPYAVIAAGIAFGLDETKQKIGDVLVATQIQDYELGRLNENGTLTRGDKPGCSGRLLNRLRQINTTEQRRLVDWPKVRFGLMLSGQKLVDNLDFRERLKTLFPEAIGGEMEATGLYASAHEAKVDWIVVKAICDWGHGKNNAQKEDWQKLAAHNAALVLKAALDVGPLYSGGHENPGSTNTKAVSRETGSQLPGASSPPTSGVKSKALENWEKKLDFLLAEEAIVTDAEQKFSIQQRIEEARRKIEEHGGKL